MPYRKLPASDPDMLNAMRKLLNAYDLNVTQQPDESKRIYAITPETHSQLAALEPVFAGESEERSNALALQSGSTMQKNIALKRLKKVTEHFLMVMNLAIDRGVYHQSIRALYGLDINSKSIPHKYGHNDIEFWARNVVGGETERIAGGGVPMQNPSLADVQTALDEYMLIRETQLKLKNDYDLQQEDVEHMRKQVRTVIKDCWDEIEFYYRRDKPPSLRRKARRWGVEYQNRPNEKPEE